MERRYFTLEGANRLVPAVAAAMDRALQLRVLLRREIDALAHQGLHVSQAVLMGREPERVPPGSENALERARGLYATIMDELRSVEALGADVKGREDGLVDFWSLLDGETEVLLCWKLGESAIAFFHHPDDGFAGRKPVSGRRFSDVRRST